MPTSDDLRARLASPDPKCANCKWYIRVYMSSDRKKEHPIPAKGSCSEPSIGPGTVFMVTDLSLCSLWTPKDNV